ncbi:MAG: universal stress protein, partial [Longimicrobiales bacterium]
MSRRIRNIVTGIAEVEQGEPHLGPAIELAQALEAALHVVHAYNLPDPSLYPNLEPSIFSPDVMQHAYERAERRLEEHVRNITGSDRVRCHARPGPAAPAILDVADEVDADLIIVGATHHGRIARAIMGTTAQRVIRAARVPVLVTGPRHQRIRRVLLTTDLSGLSPGVNQMGMELVEMLAADGEPELRALLVVGYDLPLIMPL